MGRKSWSGAWDVPAPRPRSEPVFLCSGTVTLPPAGLLEAGTWQGPGRGGVCWIGGGSFQRQKLGEHGSEQPPGSSGCPQGRPVTFSLSF